MIRMSNVSRHRPQDTLEWFYKEWHGEHVDLMRAAPGVVRLVRRYVQNPAVRVPGTPDPLLPLGPEGWDAMSQLTFDDKDSFIACFSDPDYIATVRSHALSDPAVVVSMLTESEILKDGRQTDESVKLVQFYRKHGGASDKEVLAGLADFDSELQSSPEVVRFVRNAPTAQVAPSVFVGSRWEGVPFNEFTAFDEIYFPDHGALVQFLKRPEPRVLIEGLFETLLAPTSFTFLCREIMQINSLEIN